MKTKITLLLLFLLIPTLLIAQTEWFVSPTGLATNTGTTDTDPWDLQTALNSSSVQAGHTILLAGGQYDGRFTSTISGTAGAGNEITVRSKNGEWAVLNGNVTSSEASVLTVTGGYVHFKDFEITHVGNFTRNLDDSNFSICDGLNHPSGVNCQFLNLVIHDNPGSGVQSSKTTGGSRFYGNVVYNNGWVEPSGSRYWHGVGFYVQNDTNETRLLENNIVFNQFYKGMEIWSACTSNCDAITTSTDGFIKNITALYNTVFNSSNIAAGSGGKDNMIVGTDDSEGFNIARNVNISNNVLYHNTDFTVDGTLDEAPSLTIGWRESAPSDNITVSNNYILGRNNALRFFNIDKLSFNNNVFWGRYLNIRNDNISTGRTNNWLFENNRYYTRYSASFRIVNPQVDYNFTQWQGLGLDPVSSGSFRKLYTNISDEDFTEITQNLVNPNVFKVVVLNVGGSQGSVDFSGFTNLMPGLKCTIRDVENYFNEIEVPLNDTMIIDLPNETLFATPLGSGFTDNSEKTPSNFGVYIIEFEDKCEDQTTWNGTAWDNGTPNEFKKAIIDDVYNTTTHAEFEACSLEVTVNGSLTIEPNNTITVHNNLTNKSTPQNFIVKDDGSLVMIEDNGVVSGDITVEKKWAEHLFNPANSPDVNSDKYSIWATPMVEEDSQINNTFSNSAVTYYWDTDKSPNQYVQIGGIQNFVPGRGYYLRQNNGSDFDLNVPRQFKGVINNGPIIESTVRHSFDVITEAPFENSHFFGNPYPSAIDLAKFYNDNIDDIEGTVYFWKQENNTTATYGGLITPEWVTVNGLGSVPEGEATQFVSTAQGFAVLAKEYTDGSVIFKNSQRVINNNTQFFKTSKTKKVASKNTNNTNSNKIWLQMLNEVAVSQMLLGFLPETSNAYNSYYDGKLVEETSLIEFYSILDDDKFVIQGRDELMFTSQSVPLGYKVTQAGNYTIEIDQEYISQNFSIILEDALESTFTDLRAGSYEFSVAAPIEDNTRFVLHFNYADPTVIASFDYEKQCDSYGFDIDFTFTGGTENATFLWDFGPDASPQTSTEENPIGVVFPEGDYDVTLTVSKNGTVDSIIQTVSVVDVGSYGANKVVVCHNGENVITVSVNALQTHLSHGDCIGACVENVASKSSKKSKNIQSVESIQDKDILLYPNPATDELTIELSADKHYNLLRIVDVSGRVVNEQIIHETKMNLNVSSLSKGMYFLRVQLDNKQIGMKKFIKN